MEPHQERVKDERIQLSERLMKLNGFLASEAFKNLPVWDQEILSKQANVMDQYLRILDARIKNF